MLRRFAREAALQALFQVDVGKVDVDLALETAISLHDLPSSARDFAQELLETALINRQDIDKLIQTYSVGWTLERMANVDRNILRLAVAELLFFDDIPEGASINEAVELGKKYGEVNSAKFINGILGSVAREVRSSSVSLKGDE